MPIVRLQCADCGATPGWLPPFLLPHKQYPLETIEPAIEAYVTGVDGYVSCLSSLAEETISAKTLFAWVGVLSLQSKTFLNIVLQVLTQLKPNWNIEKDRRLSAGFIPSARNSEKQMGLNALRQIYILREYFTSIVAPEYFLCWLIFQTRAPMSRPTQLGNEPHGLIRDNGPPKPAGEGG
ncbi:MAG: hypothetical protein H8E42_00355 [Nitrospinae bacterium]|nr:hypothetical protein [Nitrospinota bacterium]